MSLQRTQPQALSARKLHNDYNGKRFNVRGSGYHSLYFANLKLVLAHYLCSEIYIELSDVNLFTHKTRNTKKVSSQNLLLLINLTSTLKN